MNSFSLSSKSAPSNSRSPHSNQLVGEFRPCSTALELTWRQLAEMRQVWAFRLKPYLAPWPLMGKKTSAKCLRIKQIQATNCRVRSRKLPSSFVMARTTRVGSIHCLRPQNRLSSDTVLLPSEKLCKTLQQNLTVKNQTNCNQ